MSDNEIKNVAKMQTSYVKQKEDATISANRKRKVLFRRLAAFFIAAAAVSIFMITTLVSQSAALDEKLAEKKKLEDELAELESKQVVLEEEIVKLNDDEYIAKLARKDYYLSDKSETIFVLPESEETPDKEKDKEKEKASE
ncbi:FtsB family cell division protein [Cytobacillus gottheilii]|uniref:FtsB family cell division protein n=1 Tax=Cytobacillus gottheilii TaxID=859144 RepID=UPI0009BA21C4|nr:septum formation initiator family protein [Cytobacillus gottheilii]